MFQNDQNYPRNSTYSNYYSSEQNVFNQQQQQPLHQVSSATFLTWKKVLIAVIAAIVIVVVIAVVVILVLNSTNQYNQNVQCGQTPNSPSIDGSSLNSAGRIMNGQSAVPYSWPWMVSLRYITSKTQSTHYCAGFLVYNNIVITAAHCVSSIPFGSSIGVAVGIYNTQDALTLNSNLFIAQSFAINPNYNSTTLTNDIAVIKLATAVTFSSNVRPICLPLSIANSSDIYNQQTVLAGWGSTTGADVPIMSLNLQQTILKALDVSNSICTAVVSSYSEATNYCAIGANSNSNACYGDSGGPLMYYVGGSWFAYGLTSFISESGGNCIPSLPSFYAKIPTYLTWITSTISSLR